MKLTAPQTLAVLSVTWTQMAQGRMPLSVTLRGVIAGVSKVRGVSGHARVRWCSSCPIAESNPCVTP